MSTIFNSSNTYAGFYQTYAGGEAAIRISRSAGGTAVDVDSDAGDGFMVNQYRATFTRQVGQLRFLNMKEIVGTLGAGQGALTLTGLVGRLEDFEKLLLGSNNDTEDICNQLVIEITDMSSMVACTNGQANKAKGTIRCSGGIVQGIELGGQIDASGVLMQTGNLTIQFTQLDINPKSTPKADINLPGVPAAENDPQ